jgi:hypothetical protein
MTDIYARHDKAFANVSAFVILDGRDRVATVSFKFGAAVTAFVHWLGAEMVAGRACGGGYDRKTAACANAARKLPKHFKACDARLAEMQADIPAEKRARRDAFLTAMMEDTGHEWRWHLEQAGFTVLQAV